MAPLRQCESATGDLLGQLVVVLAALAGGDRLVVSGIVGTFAVVPPGAPFADAAREVALGAVAEVLAAAVLVSAPAAAGVLAADLALASVVRVAPGLGAVGAAAQPARATLGLSRSPPAPLPPAAGSWRWRPWAAPHRASSRQRRARRAKRAALPRRRRLRAARRRLGGGAAAELSIPAALAGGLLGLEVFGAGDRDGLARALRAAVTAGLLRLAS